MRTRETLYTLFNLLILENLAFGTYLTASNINWKDQAINNAFKACSEWIGPIMLIVGIILLICFIHAKKG